MEPNSGPSDPAEAAERLRRSELLHRTLTANLPDTSVFLFDRDLRILIAEGEGVRRLPWIDEEMFRGRTVHELQGELPPEILALSLECYQGALAGERRVFEFTSVGLTYEVTAVPIHGRNGEVESAMAVVRDVTDRRAVAADRAEQALLIAEERYRDLFESSPAGIVQVALDGAPVSVNHAWASLMGYDSPEQVLVEVANMRDLYEDPADRETMLRIVREQGEAKGFEVRLRRRDGATVWVAMDAGPITNTAGEVLGLQWTGVDITERKRAEEALRESEERFRLLAENSRDVIRLYDTDATIRYASPSCAVVLGYSAEELVGHPADEFQHPDDVAGGEGRQQAVIAAEDELTVTYRSRHKDGGYVWLESSLRALRDEPGGAVTGFQEAARDVGERKQAEEALRASEERYRELFEDSPAGRVESTVAGAPLRVNRAFAALLGYASPEQFMSLVSRTSVLYADPGEREAVAALFREHAVVRGFELRMRRRDGTTVWVAIDGRAVTNADGGTRRWQASVVDISERKATEAALRESEERFRLLAENSTDVITRVSTQSIMLYVSPASRELYGYEPEEMIGRSAWEYIHPEDHPMVRQASEAVRIPGSHHHTVEYRARRSDGSDVWVESKVRTLWDPVTGQAAGFHNATRDISERKHVEEALRESEERFRLLAAKLTDRTVALEAVNQELESFSYSVSHDLRAPLRAIDGFTAMLQGDYADKLDDTGQNMLARVRRATAKMSTLIDALLVLSRLSRGQLTRTRLDVSALASEIEEELRDSDPDRVVEFVIEDGLYAVADGGLTRTALTNLLGNAWKFSAQREDGRIEFASAGGRSFVVRDNGLGFDMTYVDKLFVPFERLHRPDEVAGTGIGLATVNRIVNRHGGQLRGEGTVGEGAAFYFDFGDEALLG